MKMTSKQTRDKIAKIRANMDTRPAYIIEEEARAARRAACKGDTLDLGEASEYEKLCEAQEAAADQRDYNNAIIKLYKNNLARAIFDEIAPAIADALALYDGKPAGEKTRKKVCDIISASPDIEYAYFSGAYLHLRVSDIHDTLDICHSRNDARMIDPSTNTFCAIPAADMWLCGYPYTENPEKHIKKMLASRAAIAKRWEALYQSIKDHNRENNITALEISDRELHKLSWRVQL